MKTQTEILPDEWKTYPYPLTGITVCGECGQPMCGKSAHGKNKKHHCYDHPRMPRASGVDHTHKCQIQRLRAEKIEDIVTKSIKQLLGESGRIEAAIRAYGQSQELDLPVVKNRLKTLTDEVRESERKVDNLVSRIAELPTGVSAAPMYKKLELLQAKIAENQNLKVKLESELRQSEKRDVSKDQLKSILEKTIAKLETAPKENQRDIFSNVIQFAEVHPTKIRLGVYTAEQNAEGFGQSSAARGATGTSGSNVCSILSGSQGYGLAGSHTIKVGGEGEIRTHETVLQSTRFRIERLRPLGHLSVQVCVNPS